MHQCVPRVSAVAAVNGRRGTGMVGGLIERRKTVAAIGMFPTSAAEAG